MPGERDVHVYLLPQLVPPERLRGGLAVVIDVLRATTTIVHALAAGCASVRPCAEVEEARTLADTMHAGKVLLGGERGGTAPAGFDLGNSPKRYTPRVCRDTTLVFTTTNGTRAILRCGEAARTLVAAFVNYSAVCEQLRQDRRPVYIVCAGTDGEVTLEDTLLAGALVDCLAELGSSRLNDGARIAWDCFETHGHCLDAALELSQGAQNLKRLGLDEDIADAGRIDAFNLVPEVRGDPLRIEVGAVGIVSSHWMRK
jgi:2-phosphosulfolactate phosphatase